MFEDDYHFSKVLGKGSFSQVKLATQTRSGLEVAVKIVNKSKMTESDEKSLQQEVEILRLVRDQHPGVIQLLDKHEDADFHYLVLELMTGGELFTRIVKQTKFTEQDAKRVITSLASGLEYLHSIGIAHRDLKPENILCANEELDCAIKFADFGFANFANRAGGLRTACGSPAYVAPEVISGKTYNQQCDMWSLGVLLYILMCGYPPFYSSDRKVMFKRIRGAEFQFDALYWGDISAPAQELISQLLVVDPVVRLTPRQVLQHEWIRKPDSDTSQLSLLTTSTGKNLQMFNARRKFRTGFQKVIQRGKLPEFVTWVRRLSSSLGNSASSA